MKPSSDRYTIVATFCQASIKVPSKKKVEIVNTHSFRPAGSSEIVYVDEHYKAKIFVPDRYGVQIIVNQKFFGISEKDIGTTICARVEIEEKITPDQARKFTMINVYKEDNIPQNCLIISDSNSSIPILNTDYGITQVPLPIRKDGVYAKL